MSTSKTININNNNEQILLIEEGKTTKNVKLVFKWLTRGIFIICTICILYWIFSSDRYVSEATILIQNTEQVSVSNLDVTTLLSGMNGPNKSDQLLLTEYLLSIDMLKKLDRYLNLRKHYSDKKWDFASRMWLGKYYIEWFYHYYLTRITVTYDDFSGVLHIRAQAYEPQIAYKIVQFLVSDGEKFMNDMSHSIAKVQVDFLNQQVSQAQYQVKYASKELLKFQNQKGLISPKTTVESLHIIIAKLEEQRTKLQTQLTSLPRNLDKNHPARQSLIQSLAAVENQIHQERVKLASTSGKPLNSLMEEEELLQLELKFKQDLYKTSLVALEKGKMDAARALKHISVLQHPILPEFAMQPRRLYGIIVSIFICLLFIGILNLLKYIILDHVD